MTFNKLLYPIFIFRLSVLLLLFFLRAFLLLYPRIVFLFLSLGIALVNTVFFIQNKLSQESNLNIAKIVQTKTGALEKEKGKLEEALTKQNSHQGLLLNLSKIEKKIGNPNKSQKYLEMSKNQNPNSELFQ